jgi:DNA topoisomerase-3
MNYACENLHAKTCDFKSGKVILQQEMSRTQMEKLLLEGKTDLLDGFVSMRTRRKFKAFLAMGKDGKVGFEFEPRPEKPGAVKKVPAKKAATSETAPTKKVAVKKVAAKKVAAKKPVAKKVAVKSAT